MTDGEKLDAVLGELRAIRKLLEGSQKEALSMTEVAKRLSLSKSSVARLIRDGEITPFRIGRRVLVSAAEVDKMVAGEIVQPRVFKPRVRKSLMAERIRELAKH